MQSDKSYILYIQQKKIFQKVFSFSKSIAQKMSAIFVNCKIIHCKNSSQNITQSYR